MTKAEDGAAVVITLGLTAVLMVVTVVGGAVVALVATHRQVQAAADLGALAGASAAQSGDPACTAAQRVVARNGAEIIGCDSDGAEVMVVVERRWHFFGGGRTLRARARAGPVDAPG